MAKDMFWTVSTFAFIIGILMLAFWPTDKGNVVVMRYDCSIVETSPDYPGVANDHSCKTSY